MHGIWNWAKAHPYEAGAIIAVVVVGFVLLLGGFGSKQQPQVTTQGGVDPNAALAASVQLQQLQSGATLATLQSNNQTALGEASIAGAISIAGISADTEKHIADLQAGIQMAGISAQSAIAHDSIGASVTMQAQQLNEIQNLAANQTAQTIGLAEINAVGNYNLEFANNVTLLNALAIVRGADTSGIPTTVGKFIDLPLPGGPANPGGSAAGFNQSVFDVENNLHSAVIAYQANPTDPTALASLRGAAAAAGTVPGVDKAALGAINNVLAGIR